jgi:hypothetical protein
LPSAWSRSTIGRISEHASGSGAALGAGVAVAVAEPVAVGDADGVGSAFVPDLVQQASRTTDSETSSHHAGTATRAPAQPARPLRSIIPSP